MGGAAAAASAAPPDRGPANHSALPRRIDRTERTCRRFRNGRPRTPRSARTDLRYLSELVNEFAGSGSDLEAQAARNALLDVLDDILPDDDATRSTPSSRRNGGNRRPLPIHRCTRLQPSDSRHRRAAYTPPEPDARQRRTKNFATTSTLSFAYVCDHVTADVDWEGQRPRLYRGDPPCGLRPARGVGMTTFRLRTRHRAASPPDTDRPARLVRHGGGSTIQSAKGLTAGLDVPYPARDFLGLPPPSTAPIALSTTGTGPVIGFVPVRRAAWNAVDEPRRGARFSAATHGG